MMGQDNEHKTLDMARAELELRRYEARLGVWKVVLGTFIVGLAGVLVPGAINFTTLLFEDWREEARLELDRKSAHQQYIKDFFETAVTQDIELRIRFAHYFASLSEETGGESDDPSANGPWEEYLSTLLGQRTDIRNRINDLEAQLVTLKNEERTEDNVIKLDRVSRELQWAYDEIGYVALDRSPVQVVSGKKERLYQETLEIVRALATLDGPVDPTSAQYKRFWELYQRDLIPVETPAVEARMVALGRELERLATSNSPPGTEFIVLWQNLEKAMRSELIALAQAGANPLLANWGIQDFSNLSRIVEEQRSVSPVNDALVQMRRELADELDRLQQEQRASQAAPSADD